MPATGHAPLITQAGTGASPGYDAIDIRRMAVNYDCGEGVTSYDSFRVSQRGAGANMSVDINMDQTAYVRGDAVTLQGIYPVPPHSATINETVTAADATNPRIDRVVLQLQDNTHDASGQNRVQTQVLAGTPTGGATLDNLTGAASVPNSAMLLADVLVPAASSSVTNANIRDRRPFCIGSIPPLITDVEAVAFIYPTGLSQVGARANNGSTTHQAGVLAYLPRRIASATRIRWKYVQDNSTARTGNYAIGIYDASGRKIIDTGSVAFTGAASSIQVRSETITATTFEPGAYYIVWGSTGTNAGIAHYQGVIIEDDNTGGIFEAKTGIYAPNLAVKTTGAGVTLPTTILGLTDVHASTTDNVMSSVPAIALSVG